MFSLVGLRVVPPGPSRCGEPVIEGRTSPGLFPFLDRFDGFPTTICADRRLAM